MNLPKVKFIDVPLSKEVDWIHGFLFQNKLGGKTAPKYFNDLYNKITKSKKFDEFLKESYQTIKKNSKLFKI